MASLPLLRTTGSAPVQLPDGNDGVDRGNLFDDARDVLGVEQLAGIPVRRGRPRAVTACVLEVGGAVLDGRLTLRTGGS